MALLLCKNPLMQTITINFITMVLLVYSINQRITSLTISLALTRVLNKRILNNGININKQKRTIMLLSFFINVCVAIIYSTYIYSIRRNQITNRV